MKNFTHKDEFQPGLLKTAQSVVNYCLRKAVFLLLPAFFFFSSLLYAQPPVITKNIGIPSGNANCTGVAYGNNIYIAALSGGYIYSSPDGETWTKVVDAGIPAGTFTSLAFGAGNFVAVGYGGMIISSSNGLNWTSRASGTTQNLTNVQFIQSSFYVTGMNTTLRRSADGITWNTITIGAGTSTDMFLSITYGSSTFVISARNSGGSGSYIYKSATGNSNSWSVQNLNIGTLNRVQYINDRFFAFVAGHQVHTSPNATTWTDVTASISLTLPNASAGTWNSSNQIFNGFYDGTRYYFFGSSQYYSGYGSVWTSTTGTNLTLLTKTAYIVPQGSVYLNGKYFQYGNEGVVSSDDGISYHYPSGSYNSVASNGSGYVAVGMIGSNNGVIYTSLDFNTWSSKTPSNQQELYAVVHNGTKYLAVGNYTVVESTDNGNTWTQIATPTSTLTALAWGNSRFVAAGYEAGNGVIAYSANGIAWTNAVTNNNTYLKVKYVNGQFFALGYDNSSYLGIIMRSADGISWTDITPVLSFPVYYFNDVVYDGSKYHFMGMEFADPGNFIYDDFFSVSTATVTNPNSFANKGQITSPPVGKLLGGDWGQGAFAYSNGHFVGAVNDVSGSYDTYVIYSSDGINWTAEPIDETTSIWGAIAEGNTIRLIGSGDGKVTVTFSGATLPVQLLSFTGSLINSQSVLKWQTASEQNTQDFIIQHSVDGVQWNTTGTVQAAGNSSSVQQYSFIHDHPAKGLNHYRLWQRDADGRSSYSKIISLVNNGRDKQLLVYPVPVSDGKLNILLQEATTITLYNNAGILVLSKQLPAGNSLLELGRLPKGTYHLKAGKEAALIVIQ